MSRLMSALPHFDIGLAVSLRAATLVGRFGLTIALAAMASTEVVGSFGLYSSALILAYSMMGMDVYAATTRELLAAEGDGRPLRRHNGFVVVSYLLFLPLVALLFSQAGAVQGIVLLLFLVHLAFEYYCQELGRLIIVVGMPLASTFVLFVRTTIWIPFALSLLWLFPAQNPLFLLAVSWLGGSMLSAVIIWNVLRRKIDGSVAPIFDIRWMRSVVKASAIFFVATLLFRVLMNGDKFVVNEFLSRGLLGVYTVYASVAMGLLALAETGISAWLYPGLVSAIQKRDWLATRSRLSQFRNQMLVGSVLGGLALALVIPMLLAWIGKVEYTEHLQAYYYILLGAILYCISMPYHYVIYGFGKDGVFFGIYSMALLIMLVSGFSLVPKQGIVGAGAMLGIALSFIAFARFVAANKLLAKAGVPASPPA